MNMNLTKPAIEHSSEERAKIYNGLYLANCKRYAVDGGVSLMQRAAAKREAIKVMMKEGF